MVVYRKNFLCTTIYHLQTVVQIKKSLYTTVSMSRIASSATLHVLSTTSYTLNCSIRLLIAWEDQAKPLPLTP